MKKLFLIIGAPGCGKTTDAKMVAARNSEAIVHYSTGDLLRDEVTRDTSRGERIHSFISQGLIVPIGIALETIVTAIKKSSHDIILFDGYPRSIEQMNELEKFLSLEARIELVSVIEIVVSEAVARERVLGRARGADDEEKVFNNRMEVYTTPLLAIEQFYDNQGLLYKVDGERFIEEIVADIEAFVLSKI